MVNAYSSLQLFRDKKITQETLCSSPKILVNSLLQSLNLENNFLNNLCFILSSCGNLGVMNNIDGQK